MAEGEGSYEVGYGKPPKHTRFTSGQSGNPRGRKPGKRGLKTDLEAVIDEMQTIQINKQPITDTRQRLALRTLATRAATGDIKATTLLSSLILQVCGTEDRGTDRRKLSAGDQAILDELLLERAMLSPSNDIGPDQDDGVTGD